MPYIVKVATGKLEQLSIFGDDYDTVDGTGVRDYIHVVDLANGHVKALDRLFNGYGLTICNLGTGKGVSVLEMVKTFEKVNNVKINYKITERRKGDVASCYASCDYAKKILNWSAEKDLTDMCRDSYLFEVNN